MNTDLLRLDSQFNAVGATMSVTEYNQQRAVLVARAAAAPAPIAPPIPRAVAPAAPAAAPVVTFGVLKQAFDIVIEGMKSKIQAAIAPIATRLATVETRTGALAMLAGNKGQADKISEVEDLLRRVKALEDRLPLAYGGTWGDGQQSSKGFFYTAQGSVWYCKQTTRTRPGESADSWVLACKHGAAGKDSR